MACGIFTVTVVTAGTPVRANRGIQTGMLRAISAALSPGGAGTDQAFVRLYLTKGGSQPANSIIDFTADTISPGAPANWHGVHKIEGDEYLCAEMTSASLLTAIITFSTDLTEL